MAGRRIVERIVVVAVVAALLAGCGGGGSSKVSSSAYIKSVCTAIGGFLHSVKARQSQLNPATLTHATPVQGKQLIVGVVSGFASDVAKLVSQIKAAGVPDVNNGQQISTAIQTALTRVQSSVATFQTQVNQLPTSSPTAFSAGAKSVATALQQSLSGITSSLSGLSSPQLQQAASKEPACQTLSSA